MVPGTRVTIEDEVDRNGYLKWSTVSHTPHSSVCREGIILFPFAVKGEKEPIEGLRKDDESGRTHP